MDQETVRVGHNQPPSMVDYVREAVHGLSEWLSEHPVITTEEEAREGKVWIDRSALGIQDLEAERTNLVRPLNDQVKAVNTRYRGPRELLEKVADELKSRIDRYILGEEAKRRAVAAEAARIAQLAEDAARAAELKEQEAYIEADAGVLGLDIAAVTANADSAFAEHQKAQRQAALAEKETHVKVGGGFRRAASLRETEVIHIADAMKVLSAVGFTEGIKTELLKAARAYKRLKGEYPPGITTTVTRGI